ncbi:signal peptidase II [Vibrio parahaemolyticus]|uniref:signal peptidase II n=1 Tax=Vibrio parahaemolyticus TaxID=670 RepID=UPI00084A64E8|nr:signal peptidase II [Vibrio parahaemolyticus]EHR6179853.1 signal peptidase II [Vibrio parahaemolyticus]ODY31238.1 signal peptidase II [Vibrio parahaemolyticus]
MSIWKRFQVILLVSFFCIGVDQGTKLLASEHLSRNVINSYFSDVIRVGYTENIGAFLGLGNGLSDEHRFGIFVLAVGAFLLGLFFYLVINSKLNFNSLVALSMVFSGGASNFYDRVVNDGAVVDFLNVGFGSIRTGVFNIADMVIMIGGLMIILLQNKTEVAK